MKYNVGSIPFYQLLLFITVGVLLFIVCRIVHNYIIPLLTNKQYAATRYWQKAQIVLWLVYAGLFFTTLFRADMLITLIFMGVTLGLGWSFWRNVFSGIIIKFNNQFYVGETISSDFATGEIRSINLSQSELINSEGELVVIPNYKLKNAVLKHVYKKSTIQTHSFRTAALAGQTVESMHHLALNCPFISANQKIEIERTKDNEFNIKASVIDPIFVDKVYGYFLGMRE